MSYETISRAELKKWREERAVRRTEGDTSTRPTSPLWNMPTELRVILQFMTDPTNDANAVSYQAAMCMELQHSLVSGAWPAGVHGGNPRADIPAGMRDVIVRTIKRDENGLLHEYDDDIVDINGVEMGLLGKVLDGSSVNWADKKGRVIPKTRYATNVVVHSWEDSTNNSGRERRHPKEGDLILLSFTEGEWETVVDSLNAYRSTAGTDPLTQRWAIHVKKGGRDSEGKVIRRKVTIIPVGAAVPVDVTLFDVGKELDAIRAEFLNYVSAAVADQSGISNEALTTMLASVTEPTEQHAVLKANWDDMPNVKLKKLLTEAGVAIPEGAKRVQLISLANEELVSAGTSDAPPF